MLSASVPPEVKQISSAMRAETSGDALAGLVERGAGVAAPAVDARGVAEARAEERQHRLEHLGAHRRRRGVVEVDGLRHRRNIWKLRLAGG